MKKVLLETDVEMYIGEAREIKRLYNNLYYRGIASTLYAEEEKFNFDNHYGLIVNYCIEFSGLPLMTVVHASTALACIEKSSIIF